MSTNLHSIWNKCEKKQGLPSMDEVMAFVKEIFHFMIRGIEESKNGMQLLDYLSDG